MYEKLKSFLRNDTYFTVLIIILVGIASFGLGRLSMQEAAVNATQSEPFVQISESNFENNDPEFQKVPVVASKSGTKYHLMDCPGALQMKEENRIEFNSIDDAKAAGYQPAANCKGLE